MKKLTLKIEVEIDHNPTITSLPYLRRCIAEELCRMLNQVAPKQTASIEIKRVGINGISVEFG